jgi:hypothetical protein
VLIFENISLFSYNFFVFLAFSFFFAFVAADWKNVGMRFCD